MEPKALEDADAPATSEAGADALPESGVDEPTDEFFDLVDPEDGQLPVGPPPAQELLGRIREVNERIGAAQRELLELVGRLDLEAGWEHEGAGSAGHWLAMALGISSWKAHRIVAAARALPSLPRVADALERGSLSLDKVVELCRFAAPSTEGRLVAWATRVAPAAVRERGDRERARVVDAAEAHEQRELRRWQLSETLGCLQAILPTAELDGVMAGIDRTAATLPTLPGERGSRTSDQKRADALVAICSAQRSADPDPDRATLVVHTTVREPATSAPAIDTAEVECGGPLAPQVAARLACDARIQLVSEDDQGHVLGATPTRREPPVWMLRQLRWRDKGCRFPGCGRRAYTQAHHITYFSRGGPTTLDNLVLVCFLHHRLVHEYGWTITTGPKEGDDELAWVRPDGVRYRAGPAP